MGSEKVNDELGGIAGADSPEVRAILSALFFFSLPRSSHSDLQYTLFGNPGF